MKSTTNSHLKLYAKALEIKWIEACLIGDRKGHSIRDVSYYFISEHSSSFSKLSCYFRLLLLFLRKAKLNVYEARGYTRLLLCDIRRVYRQSTAAFKWQRYLIEWEIAFRIYTGRILLQKIILLRLKILQENNPALISKHHTTYI